MSGEGSSGFPDVRHRRGGAGGLGTASNLGRTAENARLCLDGIFICVLLTLPEFTPTTAVLSVENLNQRIFVPTFRRSEGRLNTPKGKRCSMSP